jgi:hypothetical protein
MTTYNGHKNWNHWNVSLWINNDEGLYAIARQCVRVSITKDRAAGLLLSMIHDNVGTHTPDGAPYTKTSLRAAIVGM